jgi:hypothetical protein
MFRDWQPDLPKLLNQGVFTAKNCAPIAGGFGPVKSWVDAGEDALDAYCRGGLAAIDNSRHPHNFGSDATKLYRIYTSGLEDVSQDGGYNCGGNNRWSFENFGQMIFAANANDKLQYFDLRSSTVFAEVPGLFVPRFRHLGVVGEHLIGGNYYDSLDGSVPHGIAFPAIRDAMNWPDPRTDSATAVQSDRQALEGDGGWVQAVVSGAEVGAIFQERAIWRADYSGGARIYDLNRVEPGYGLLIPGLVVGFGRSVFFLSEQGFRIFDYTASRPAGKERIDRWFFNDYDSDYPHRVTAKRDPDSTGLWVSYPGAGNSGGTPNRLLYYDYELDRFAYGDQVLEALSHFVTPSYDTLDSPPAEALDDGYEGYIGGSFDDEVSSAGAFTMGGWDSNHKLGSFSGANKEAVFESTHEFVAGRKSTVHKILPLVDSEEGITTEVAGLEKQKSTVVYGPARKATRSGFHKHREKGRFHRIRTTVPGSAFTEALGLDLTVAPGGYR